MRVAKSKKYLGLILFFGAIVSIPVAGQESGSKKRERVTKVGLAVPLANDIPLDDDSDVKAVKDYYVNYLTEYRLGPEDVISVQVFGQCPDYCKDEIIVPPTALISYPLIREGIFVGGKTIDQVVGEITRKLDEYIIDPKVTVSLVKVGSARYSVVGKVERQGNYLMTRRISVFDAIAESGGIAKDGDKKRAVILRPNGSSQKLDPILVDLKEIQEGKAEMAFLKPGDQVLIPKEGFNFGTLLDGLGKFSLLRILFPF